ncbi:Kctd12-like [Carabus blaptoides fortunei]
MRFSSESTPGLRSAVLPAVPDPQLPYNLKPCSASMSNACSKNECFKKNRDFPELYIGQTITAELKAATTYH